MKNLGKFSESAISKNEMKNIKGADGIHIFCLTGVLDGVKHNTHFNWGRCR
jgi:hypothetical protein